MYPCKIIYLHIYLSNIWIFMYTPQKSSLTDDKPGSYPIHVGNCFVSENIFSVSKMAYVSQIKFMNLMNENADIVGCLCM